MYKLCMNPLKCAFGLPSSKFLGFLVHHRCISMDLAKTTTMVIIKMPIVVKELKSFLGRVSHIKRFIPSLTSITHGLSKLLKNGAEFI